ncbi:hypothetical protein FAVG1_02380 [Fusarium avenaceum]|nr:hypothetical protein FAVG1_02380 [Fusarium avenaceum]
MDKSRRDNSAIAYFSKLSPEILRSIFGYVCPHCCNEYQWPFGAPPPSKRSQDNTTLYNLCLISRYFRPFAQEILHHSFDPCYPRCGAPNPWERRLEPFLRTMASRPHLASSVKTVFLKVALVEPLDFDQCRKAFDACARTLGRSAEDVYEKGHATDSSAIKRAFLRGAPPPQYMRSEDFIPTVMGQILSILVSILSSLAHICVEANRCWQFDVSLATLDVLGINSIPLKTLESDHALQNLLSRSPELETLVTSGSGEYPNMPGVRNLHIRSQMAIQISTISHCLSVCTGTLSTFSYTAFDSDIVGVVNVLNESRFRASLESLHLDMRRRNSRGNHKMPSLNAFTQMKRLFLHTYFLYGTEYSGSGDKTSVIKSLLNILPPNITSLQLSEQTETPHGVMGEDLLRLASNARVEFPQLRKIESDADNVCDKYLETLFKTIGVDLIHQDLPMCCWIDTIFRITGVVDWNDVCHGGANMIPPGLLSDEDL